MFVVRGALIFPAAAALAWTVLAYVCIDFGFWRKIFNFDDDAERIWRAGVEATIGATLIVFLFAYLNLRRWHVRFLHIGAVWLLLMAVVVGLSIYNRADRGGRRAHLDRHRRRHRLVADPQPRGARLGPRGDVDSDLVPARRLGGGGGAAAMGVSPTISPRPGLIGGLVLIVMLIGFTIMQSAFSGAGRCSAGGADAERRALAMTGCGDAIFDWNVVATRSTSAATSRAQLGLRRGALEGPAGELARNPAPARPRPLRRRARRPAAPALGPHHHDIRLRGADGHYSWFLLKARPVLSAEGDVVRVIGSLADVTETKAAEERILHDAIHDNLTGLPNRELFFDRLETRAVAARRPGAPRPVVIVIDIDRLKAVNDSLGLSFGDSALLTVARRAARDLSPAIRWPGSAATSSALSPSRRRRRRSAARWPNGCARARDRRSVSAIGKSPSPPRLE